MFEARDDTSEKRWGCPLRAGVFMALAGAVLGGCAAESTTWLRYDNQQIVGNANLERQFAADEAICEGQVAKADTASALSASLAKESIYRGCMSVRGYYERQ
jgi:hypothetical protein